jgi:drug/metabolite transporter (DMT)-like permease
MAARSDERSLGELFAELSRDTGLLVRKEVELATTELTTKAKVASMHAATVAAGGALAHAGVLVLLAALVSLLVRLGVEVWLSAGIIAFLTMAIGYFLVNKGLANLRQANLAPTQTIQSIKETTSWTNRTPA